MSHGRLFALLALFYAVFLVCAGLLHHRSGFSPLKGGGALDQFNAAMLWGTSVLALLITVQQTTRWKTLFWLAVSAGFGALAIDEAFEFHEDTRHSLGDDDYIKVAAWSAALAGAFAIVRVGRVSREVTAGLLAALAFQTLWLLSDLGDGDLFALPVELRTLQWMEEYFELLASQFYLTALVVHYREILGEGRASVPA